MSCVGSTQPGDGSVMRNVVVDPPKWREKFIGYAKKYRGAMLRQVRVGTLWPSPAMVLII